MWILIVITLGYGFNGPTNITSQEFLSESTCLAAGEKLVKLSPIKWACVKK